MKFKKSSRWDADAYHLVGYGMESYFRADVAG